MPSMPPAEPESYPIGLSVIVPAYNEEALLKGAVEHLVKTIPGLGMPAEIIIVDDGSLDGTPALADELAAAHDVVSVHHHRHNQGFYLLSDWAGFITGQMIPITGGD